jgi:hypothetical protein
MAIVSAHYLVEQRERSQVKVLLDSSMNRTGFAGGSDVPRV